MEILYCWTCDNSENTGEGNLANLFLKKKAIIYKVYIFNVKKIFTEYNFFFNILNYKYISPIIGVGFCWYFFLKKKKIAFINYIPLWNFLLFIFLPPKTIFGPITGGSNFKEDKNFIRRYIFPHLYKISEFFLNIRVQKIYFSTDLLKPFLNKSTTQTRIIDSNLYYKLNFNFDNYTYYYSNTNNNTEIELIEWFEYLNPSA